MKTNILATLMKHLIYDSIIYFSEAIFDTKNTLKKICNVKIKIKCLQLNRSNNLKNNNIATIIYFLHQWQQEMFYSDIDKLQHQIVAKALTNETKYGRNSIKTKICNN